MQHLNVVIIDRRETFAYLIDPKLQPQEQSPERLFLKYLHRLFSRFSASNMFLSQLSLRVGPVGDVEFVSEHISPELKPLFILVGGNHELV
jgi:hypothetical protein